MPDRANRVFISYRRGDAAGYAGRLEEALERRLGRGSVFRDVLDIAPGTDFVEVIRERLAGAHTVLALIGPNWAGTEVDGRRRIDDEHDFVRLELAVALEGGAAVVPVLLPGATMPSAASLPDVLKPLARRHALTLGEAHWDADVDRLAASFGSATRRAFLWWAIGGAGLAGALAAAWLWRPGAPADDVGARLVGTWRAEVRYPWGDRHLERFEFRRHAGQLTGTAGFLGYPRAIENLRFDGGYLYFETRSQETMAASTREVTRAYAAELRGKPPDEVLRFRMESRGNHVGVAPVAFEARRVAVADGAKTRP